MSKSLKILAVMVGSLLVTMFLFRHMNGDPSSWIAVAVVMIVIYLAFGIPAIGNFVASHPRAVFWSGIGLAVGGIGAMFTLFFFSSFYKFPRGVTGTDPMSLATMYVMMIGIALTVIPRGVIAQKRLEPLLIKSPRNSKAQTVRGKTAGGIGEASRAILATLGRIVPFFRLAGIWILVVWVAPLIGLYVASHSTGLSIDALVTSTDKKNMALTFVATRLSLIPASFFAFPTVLVAWHRYVLEGYKPRFALPLPNWRTMRYLFRLYIMLLLFGILVRIAATNGPDLAALLGIKDEVLVSEALFWSVLLIEVVLSCPYALTFPAIAVGNRQFVALDGVAIARRSPYSYRAGFVVSLVPLALVCWGWTAMLARFDAEGIWGVRYAFQVIPLALIFMSLAICATYLSRVYAKAIETPERPDVTASVLPRSV